MGCLTTFSPRVVLPSTVLTIFKMVYGRPSAPAGKSMSSYMESVSTWPATAGNRRCMDRSPLLDARLSRPPPGTDAAWTAHRSSMRDSAGHRPQGVLQNVQPFRQLLVGHDQRHGEAQDVAVDAGLQDDGAASPRFLRNAGGALRIRLLGLLVLHDLQRNHR